MKIVSLKTLLLGSILTLTGNSTLLAARNWFDAGVYAAVALSSGVIAHAAHCTQKPPTPTLRKTLSYTSLICAFTTLKAIKALCTQQANKKLTPCRQ